MTRRELGLACFVGFLGLALGPLAVVGPSFTHLPGDLVDNRFNLFILEHGYRYLTGVEKSFWHVGMCYPARYVTANSDAHLANLPIYASLRILGQSPERAFQLYWFSTFILTYSASVWGMRRLGYSALAAIAVGVAFTFAVPLNAALTHIQVYQRGPLVLCAVAWWLFLKSPTWTRLAETMAWGLLQLYSSVYLAYFLAWWLLIQTLVAACVGGIIDWPRLWRATGREWRNRVFVLLATSALLIPLARPYLLKPRDADRPTRETILSMTPEPLDWLRPSDAAASWSWFKLHLADQPGSRDLFPGGTACLGLLFGLFAMLLMRRSESRRVIVVTAISCVVMVLIVTKFSGWCAYQYCLDFPIANTIRAVFRVILVLMLPLAMLFGSAVMWLEQQLATKVPHALIGACTLTLVLLDTRTHSPDLSGTVPQRVSIAECVARRGRIADIIRRHPQTKIVHLFTDETEFYRVLIVQLDAMLAAQSCNVATTNGWTGHWPKGWFPFQNLSGLLHWLRINNRLTADGVPGLLLLGTPSDVQMTETERQLRREFPIVSVPSWP